ncbi:nuclear transport factor 2 family protein [Vibrio campbellii]|uniref:nuclear transport factor 2 family protein n=1 Tax=Vibrio chagasii TaxID=170679 RepID=UPI001EFDFC0A|nr:nuclear transport factor 2 family protein [Vibrio chagasii]MCG9604415.1 nuclear transport factor 2 family protein [Vibrio chagasii]
MTPKEVVLGFWEAMRTNDFAKASEWLAEDFQGYWPQSSELTVGRDNFTAINSEYPANDVWKFTLNSIVCEGDTVVTDVSVTDSVLNDRVITFHTVVDGLIQKQTEFWPDGFAPQEWRSQWVQLVSPEVFEQ